MKSKKKLAKSKRKREDSDNLVFADEKESFWEVETVLDRRIKDNQVQYLIKWKGFRRRQATWEPIDNLCDSALEEALELSRIHDQTNSNEVNGDHLEAAVTELVESELGDSGDCEIDQEIMYSSESDSPKKTLPPLQDGRWRWTDEEQLKFRDIERINVHDSDARQRVTDARLNGTPLVLIGHTGWANFSKNWLVPVSDQPPTEAKESNGENASWLDLSKNHRLDIQKMIADLGNDLVPVISKNYNEHNPLQAKVKISTFLQTYWPDENGNCKSNESLYLHQWQFPLSPIAGERLCHKNRELPNRILGEDLLRHWLDLPQCRMDSAFQYIFMGREGTMSKLHRDKGGLAISIAPIVGVKECVLIHRSDGATCFYHLDASLENIDLEAFPLMAHARIWKTSIKPGEILLMPQGTFHQCRNVTPCLSYSRFHLDTVNLLPFLQSMVDGDAKEIQHGEVIWNACNGVMGEIDTFVDECRRCVQPTPPKPCPQLTEAMVDLVETLRSLRNICRETLRRLEVVKGKDRQHNDNMYDIGTASDWRKMVGDIDDSLHHFRHRGDEKIRPRCRSRKVMDGAVREDLERTGMNHEFGANVVAALERLDYRSNFRSKSPKPEEVDLEVADLVIVSLQKKDVLGTIIAIKEQMNAAYLSYDGFPSAYDEYQPYSKIRVSVGGESVEVCPSEVKAGMKVLNQWGETGEEYRAVVARTCCERFFSIRLFVPPSHYFNRWFPFSDIVSRAVKSSKR